MWRPKDKWNNPYKESNCEPLGLCNSYGVVGECVVQKCAGGAFEEGADAMLKSLRESPDSVRVEIPVGTYTSGTTGLVTLKVSDIPGTWVFIPDEDEGGKVNG